MRYRALFLDMDGTFLDFHAAEQEAYRSAMDWAGLAATQEGYRLYSAINDGLWKAFERGEIQKQDIRNRRFAQLFLALGIESDSVAVEQRYEGFLAQGHTLIPHAREVLAQLSCRLPLYVVTNGFAQVQKNRLKLAGIDGFMTDCFASEELGFQKPQKAFFDACFSRIQKPLSPGEVLLVGDSLTSDILGAANAGLVSCWFNPDGKKNETNLRPDYEIRDLTQLPALLEEA